MGGHKHRSAYWLRNQLDRKMRLLVLILRGHDYLFTGSWTYVFFSADQLSCLRRSRVVRINEQRARDTLVSWSAFKDLG